MSDELPNHLAIASYIHCGLCIQELQAGSPDADDPLPPREYQQLEVGWTKQGLQVWCKRHGVNVVHIDFEGRKHPANTSRQRLPNE